MIERPILFSGEMVRAILEGRKTITRRVIKPQPPDWIKEFGYTCFTPKGSISGRGEYQDNVGEKFFKSPYGQPGDLLWCKETWAWGCGLDNHENCDRDCIKYRVDEEYPGEFGLKWKSSRFMPKVASRIALAITSIRVERLLKISEEDAFKEGCTPNEVGQTTAKENFENLWNQINGKKYPWESNPWVFVISFVRTK